MEVQENSLLILTSSCQIWQVLKNKTWQDKLAEKSHLPYQVWRNLATWPGTHERRAGKDRNSLGYLQDWLALGMRDICLWVVPTSTYHDILCSDTGITPDGHLRQIFNQLVTVRLSRVRQLTLYQGHYGDLDVLSRRCLLVNTEGRSYCRSRTWRFSYCCLCLHPIVWCMIICPTATATIQCDL